MNLKIRKRINKEALNQDIEVFPEVYPVTDDMEMGFTEISRMIMLDRYSFKDLEKKTLKIGDLIVLTVKDDPEYPVKGLGFVTAIDRDKKEVSVELADEYKASLSVEEQEMDTVIRSIASIDKPMEVFFEQIAKRNAHGLTALESGKAREELESKFYEELSNLRLVPAGRVLYGAGAQTDVTYFNCYVMPYPKDSRGGLSKHREEAMEIMSRGGGVGTNGSTLRPNDALVRGVNGKSSGSVSWLNDLSALTHLVQQGGSRRGAQMIMLADSHPDIIEFIISKMQNPEILRFIIRTTNDEQIKHIAQEKLKFVPLKQEERGMYESITQLDKAIQEESFSEEVIHKAESQLKDGGYYDVEDRDALTGANISVAITDDFMEAVEQDLMWDLRFPDVENYSKEEMKTYDEHWHEVGDVREWEELGHKVKTYRQIRAKDLWELINICATYAAEPGIFYIDRANEETNAKAYGQKVVATNPCFHPETKITTGKGLIGIEKLYEEQQDDSFELIVDKRANNASDELGVEAKEAIVFPTGEKETVNLYLKNGMLLKVTPDHRIQTGSGWIEAKDLTTEDEIYIQSGEGKFGDNELGDDITNVLGWITGDGWVAQDKRIGFVFGEKTDLAEKEVMASAKRLFGKIPAKQERSELVSQYSYKNNEVFEKLSDLGLEKGYAHTKRVPDTIFTATKKDVINYLSVLFDTDGTVYTKDVNRMDARLTSSSIELLRDVQTLLINLGIHGKIYNRGSQKEAFSYTTVNGEKRTYDTKEYYELVISGRNLYRFKETIGFKYASHKAEKLERVKELSRKRELFKTTLAKREAGETVTVYDITEGDTHSLIAGGIVCHNCGEQPLAPYSVCNLAAVNLAEMVNKDTKEVQYEAIKETVRVAIQLQDNVIDTTPYFLEANEKQALGERRIGLGVMALADLLIYSGHRYGSEEGNKVIDKVFKTIAVTAYETSIELAKEKGSFPFLVADTEEETLALRRKFTQTGYMKKMPQHVRDGVMKHGIRNSHLLTVAPTGSTGTMVDVGTGLEPYFAFKYFRSGRLGKFIEMNSPIAKEYLDKHPEADSDNLPDEFVSAMELSPLEHVSVQNAVQRWVDSSISKTVNAPKGFTVRQVAEVYEALYEGGAKGGTVYVDGSRDTQVLTLGDSDDEESAASAAPEESMLDSKAEDSSENFKDTKDEDSDIIYGVEPGNTCPVCREGIVETIAGCNTCTNCGVQLTCGL